MGLSFTPSSHFLFLFIYRYIIIAYSLWHLSHRYRMSTRKKWNSPLRTCLECILCNNYLYNWTQAILYVVRNCASKEVWKLSLLFMWFFFEFPMEFQLKFWIFQLYNRTFQKNPWFFQLHCWTFQLFFWFSYF